jgi:hypothetical protein
MREKYSEVLAKYVHEKAVEQIVNWILDYGVHLKITASRSTKLGDFRPNMSKSKGHRITINYNLNQHSFLITLVHELAHLVTWNQHGHSAKPHGYEWKLNYRNMLVPFIRQGIFPDDVTSALINYIDNPAASSCTDTLLMRTLMNYDDQISILLEDIPEKAVFRLETGRVFKKGDKRRKYYQCLEVSSGRLYLINPLAVVEPVRG